MSNQPTFTSGEAAAIAQMPQETLRVWLRRDYFNFERTTGWRRFTFLQVMIIGCFAEVVAKTNDHDLAREVSRWAYLSLMKTTPGTPCYVVAVTLPEPNEDGDKFDLDRFDKLSEALQYLGEVLDGTTYGTPETACRIINIGEIAKRLAARAMAVTFPDTEAEQ